MAKAVFTVHCSDKNCKRLGDVLVVVCTVCCVMCVFYDYSVCTVWWPQVQRRVLRFASTRGSGAGCLAVNHTIGDVDFFIL
jgi:hypothetical protein